jgi:hypothetical protein
MSTIKPLCDVAVESYWCLRCRGVMSLLSHTGDDVADATWLWHDVIVESTLSRQLGRGAMSMSSHASDGAVDSTVVRCRC